ncbi:major capsid protein [uncultured Kiloniella sp.]|uniref:major capsid protein n=1 Tax=uncultured Kiloniella sp. TaxID=1133091 RepID=UPI00262D2623|nr:major capsid protein [uncultured Kiloniella sp.]
MASFDVFEGSAFNMISLTSAINHTEHAPSRLRSSGLFRPRGVNTTKIAIEEKHGSLSLIQTSERGTPPSESANKRRNIKDFRTVHLSRNARLVADEVAGIRAFGSQSELESVMAVYKEREEEKIMEMDLTIERLMLGAISGKILDADDTVIYNLFDEFRVNSPANISFAFSGITQANADNGVINKVCLDIKRQLKKALHGMPTGGMRIKALCGDNFFDALVHNAETMQPYKNWQAAEVLKDRNLAYSTFRYGGITFENYEGTDDGKVAIGTDECRIYVEGVPGLFDIYFAPADTMNFVNTKGLPMYSLPYRDPRDKFWEAEIQSNPLPICTRPKSLPKGVKA